MFRWGVYELVENSAAWRRTGCLGACQRMPRDGRRLQDLARPLGRWPGQDGRCRPGGRGRDGRLPLPRAPRPGFDLLVAARPGRPRPVAPERRALPERPAVLADDARVPPAEPRLRWTLPDPL